MHRHVHRYAHRHTGKVRLESYENDVLGDGSRAFHDLQHDVGVDRRREASERTDMCMDMCADVLAGMWMGCV